MASWIIHLRVADALLELFQGRETEFVFGNIAPDSGVPSPDGRTVTPPKSVSHFQRLHGDYKVSGYDLYADKYLTAEKRAGYDAAALGFHLGYFSHLLTDYLWSLKIAIPSVELDREAYFRDKQAAAAKFKADWYDLDFRYLRDHPNLRAFMIYRDTEGFRNIYIDEYSPDALDIRRKYIVSFYSERRENLDREYIWLTPGQADEFVESTVEAVFAELKKYL